MEDAIHLIEQIAPGIYILLGAAALITGRRWLRWRSESATTLFELEQGLARSRRGSAATKLLILLQLAVIVFIIQRYIAPSIDTGNATSPATEEVPNDGEFLTPGPGAETEIMIDGTVVVVTAVGTIEAAPPMIGCVEGARLRIPANGMVVHEALDVVGVADADDFAFYRFELKGPSTFESFAILQDFSERVPEEDTLGSIEPAFYQPGLYEFRLVVFDTAGAMEAECTVNIRISESLVTPES